MKKLLQRLDCFIGAGGLDSIFKALLGAAFCFFALKVHVQEILPRFESRTLATWLSVLWEFLCEAETLAEIGVAVVFLPTLIVMFTFTAIHAVRSVDLWNWS